VAGRTSAGTAQAREARSRGEAVARSPQFEWLARAGLVARGVIYGVVAILAIKLALGDGGKTTSQQGALQTIARQPFGKALLILVAVGLAGYALWRLLRAALGHGPEAADDTKDRIAGLASGIAYAALCVTAVKILAGAGGGGGSPDKATGGVLDWPAGPWLVGLAGLVVIGVGLDQARKGLTRSFLEDSKTERMDRRTERAFTALGLVGHLARAVVFAMIGYFLIKAAIAYDPQKAVGLDGALAQLGHSTYGPLALGVVAAGLLAFGLYSLADARYRRV
jgi:Domain of Unknown Function (DUF1206)